MKRRKKPLLEGDSNPSARGEGNLQLILARPSGWQRNLICIIHLTLLSRPHVVLISVIWPSDKPLQSAGRKPATAYLRNSPVKSNPEVRDEE